MALRFGEEYLAYRSRTPFLIPRLQEKTERILKESRSRKGVDPTQAGAAVSGDELHFARS